MAFHLDDDNYQIIKPIGKGGMSTVYLAKDKNLDRLVALKLLHPSMSNNEKNRERLKIEALAIARINHENIVDVYTFINKDEYSYIVMEYIDGGTLSEFIEKNPINSPELALAIFLKILNGINYSHNNNIIHRDIKPENIMISKEGKIKIMDFGIASIIGETHNLTTTGSIMGSPMFMSPEHLTDEKIDKQSDIFSLGIILYWMTTKTFPFNGKNTAQLLNNILKCQYNNPQKLNPLISNEIRIIIKKILQKNKLTRYKESAQIISDIEEYFNNLEYNYKNELEIYFKSPNAYHKRFLKIIPNKYINYSNTLYQNKQYSKSISYAYLALEYDSQNSNAKSIIKKIERGNIIKKYIPISIALAIIIVIIAYIVMNNINNYSKHSSKNIIITKKYIPIAKKVILKPYTSIYKIDAILSSEDIENSIINQISKYYDDKKRNKFALKTNGENNKLKNKTLNSATLKKEGKLHIKHYKRKYKILDRKELEIKTRIIPKAAIVYINKKLYGYGNLNKIKLKTNVKYNLEIKSNGCYDYKKTLFYKNGKVNPLTIRLKWKTAKLKVLNTSKGDIFIDDNYKGSYKEYSYELKLNPTSNGNKKINLKIIKDGKILFIKNIILKAGQTIIKKI